MCVVAKFGIGHGPSSPRRFPGEVARDFAAELMLLVVALVSPRHRSVAAQLVVVRFIDGAFPGVAQQASHHSFPGRS